MTLNIFYIIITPFIGTLLGSAFVFLLKKELDLRIQRILSGFAAGVMAAASIWSLLVPSIENSREMGKLAIIPSVSGYIIGILFLLLFDKAVPLVRLNEDAKESKSSLGKIEMMIFAVTLHNIPEGMAVGVSLAGALYGTTNILIAAAMALSFGIAVQNIPEGAIISMPLSANGEKKGKAFLFGALSGIVEPIAAIITVLCAGLIIPVLPYLLSFAAGAMIYVVIEELVPEMSEAPHSAVGTISFVVGFAIMMGFDIALG